MAAQRKTKSNTTVIIVKTDNPQEAELWNKLAIIEDLSIHSFVTKAIKEYIKNVYPPELIKKHYAD